MNVLLFPWPWEDNSVDEIHCSHFIEHIPMETLIGGQDLFFAFFDEMYRVLKPEGSASLVWPDLQTVRAFMDPTHRRFIPKESMLYLNRDWRVQNKLDHYLVKCNFAVNVTHSCASEFTLLHPEAQTRRFNESWNTKIDNYATMKPIK
jgi:predicted SAM-dependent methyltransferase